MEYTEELLYSVDVESVIYISDISRQRKADRLRLENVELVRKLVHERVETVVVEVWEAVVACTDEELVLLREDETELVDNVDIPVVKPVLEEVSKLVYELLL